MLLLDFLTSSRHCKLSKTRLKSSKDLRAAPRCWCLLVRIQESVQFDLGDGPVAVAARGEHHVVRQLTLNRAIGRELRSDKTSSM